MSRNEHDGKLRHLSREVVREVLDDPQLKRWIREVVLMTLAEQLDLKERGVVRMFLNECRVRGVKIRVDKDGKLLVTNPEKLGAGLQATMILYRERIWDHLATMREREARAGITEPAATNGKPQTKT
jgi:hypothetical protein